MFIKRALAGTTLAAMLALLVPAAPALANGAASTRNILLGIGAATYLIIQHNRKVHEKYAEYDRRQAELKSENNDAWAAYTSEKNAYQNAMAEVGDLKREVAYQHGVVEQLRHQLAMSQDRSRGFQTAYAPAPAPARAAAPQRHTVTRHVARANANDVAMVSYGWGSL
jgi:cell division protein FtsB